MKAAIVDLSLENDNCPVIVILHWHFHRPGDADQKSRLNSELLFLVSNSNGMPYMFQEAIKIHQGLYNFLTLSKSYKNTF